MFANDDVAALKDTEVVVFVCHLMRFDEYIANYSVKIFVY